MARILIIDDNYDMLNMLQMLLERQGNHEITTCPNGQKGLAAAFSENPDLAIVDVMMPGISGYEVVKQLRSDPRTADMGIIILTARGQSVDRKAALAAGADDHISKPADIDTLMNHINALLERNIAKAQLKDTIVIPVLSLKGGVGVTTIAVNLASVLRQVAPTVLLDLSPTAGQCAFFLRLRPEKHWGQYLEKPETPIDSLVLKHPSNLQVLLAPPIPDRYGWPNKHQIETIIARLKAVGRFVVVDMPSLLDPTAKAVLTQAHRIVLVSGNNPAAVQVTRVTLQALQEWKARLIVIHNTFAPGPRPPTDAIQKALRAPLTVDIPYDPAQSTAMHKGMPLAAVQPKTPLVLGIKRIAQILLAR